MAKELPYYRITCQEWQNGHISTMSDSCKGVFADICPYYWVQNCQVTFEMLSEKFKTKPKTIQKLIKREVIKVQNGVVSISFLNKQMAELNKNNKYFSDMGKLGQKVKKKKAPLKPPLSPRLSYKDKDKEKDKDNITEVITIFNSITKKSFKTTSEKTRKLVQARINDGYKKEDFERVIKYKNEKWKYNDEMKAYIRPETLLSNKFESYLNECPKPKKAEIKKVEPEKEFVPPTPEEMKAIKKKAEKMGLAI